MDQNGSNNCSMKISAGAVRTDPCILNLGSNLRPSASYLSQPYLIIRKWTLAMHWIQGFMGTTRACLYGIKINK
jgi:hypothetical protein